MDGEAKVDCRRASRLLSLACERELDGRELAALKRHLAACLMCRNFQGQLEFLGKAAKAYRHGT